MVLLVGQSLLESSDGDFVLLHRRLQLLQFGDEEAHDVLLQNKRASTALRKRRVRGGDRTYVYLEMAWIESELRSAHVISRELEISGVCTSM